MASTFYNAEHYLLLEIERSISALTPSDESTIKFTIRQEVDYELSDFDEDTDTPRLFTIGNGRRLGRPLVGSGERGLSYIYDIDILYPADRRHMREAAFSDALLIYDHLLNNQSAVVGVDGRWIDLASEITIQQEDSTQRMTLPLTVHYSVTG